MKKTKTKINITIALNPKIKEYLKDNIENSSRYIEYLIIKDLIENNVVDKNEIDPDKNKITSLKNYGVEHHFQNKEFSKLVISN